MSGVGVWRLGWRCNTVEPGHCRSGLMSQTSAQRWWCWKGKLRLQLLIVFGPDEITLLWNIMKFHEKKMFSGWKVPCVIQEVNRSSLPLNRAFSQRSSTAEFSISDRLTSTFCTQLNTHLSAASTKEIKYFSIWCKKMEQKPWAKIIMNLETNVMKFHCKLRGNVNVRGVCDIYYHTSNTKHAGEMQYLWSAVERYGTLIPLRFPPWTASQKDRERNQIPLTKIILGLGLEYQPTPPLLEKQSGTPRIPQDGCIKFGRITNKNILKRIFIYVSWLGLFKPTRGIGFTFFRSIPSKVVWIFDEFR